MKLKKLLTLAVAGALFIGGVVTANAAELDAVWYAKQNPDVVAELGDSPEAMRQHYEMFGRREGRMANEHDVEGQLRRLFNAEEYASRYPDIAAAFGTDAEAMFRHYISNGLLEGRRPSEKVSQAAAAALREKVEKALADAGIAAEPGSVQLVEIITGTIAADEGGAALQQALTAAAPAIEKAVEEIVKETTDPTPTPSSGGGSSSSSSSSGTEPTKPAGGLTASSAAVKADSVKNGTGTAEVTTDDGTIKVAVTLKPDGTGALGGEPQGGEENGTQNYHLTIQITGLNDGWELTADDGGQYGYDSEENKDWNIASGKLMLWLPVKENSCKVVLKKTDNDSETAVYQVVEVTTELASGLTASSATVRADSVKNGTGTAEVTTDDGTINVAVKLTPDKNSELGGESQGGEENGTQNYHLTIPITGLTTNWKLETGGSHSGQYGYDNAEHKDWNVAAGALKLWLPVNDETSCKVVLKLGPEDGGKGATVYQVVNVTTTKIETEEETEEEAEEEAGEETEQGEGAEEE